MNKKLVFSLIGILVVMNGWRWWSSSPMENDNIQSDASTESIELTLVDTLYEQAQGRTVERDLFDYKKNISASVPLVIKQAKKESLRETNKTGERRKIKKASASQRSNLRLAGILIKENARHAFILSNGTERALAEGDILNGAYRVGEITALSVKLYKLSTKHVLTLNL